MRHPALLLLLLPGHVGVVRELRLPEVPLREDLVGDAAPPAEVVLVAGLRDDVEEPPHRLPRVLDRLLVVEESGEAVLG